jgi:hypothetical protein
VWFAGKSETISVPGAPSLDALVETADSGLNAERRRAMRDMLYRNES